MQNFSIQNTWVALNDNPQKFFIHKKVLQSIPQKISSLEINPLYSNNIQWI